MGDPFCLDYINATGIASSFTLIMTICIAIMNVVIRYVNKTLINIIGYDSESQASKLITQSIFWASFFNSSIIPVFSYGFKEMTSNWYILMGP